jgi:uncharacterized membrane protein
MSAASNLADTAASDEADRNLALAAYGLLFIAIFFAGLPALIAVAIAYGRRRNSASPVRSHFRHQIFIFWVALAFSLLAALSGLGALIVLLGEVIRGAVEGRWDSLDTILFSQAHIGLAMALVAGAGVLTVLTGVWLMATSAYGFILLASRRSISQTAR